MILSLECRKVKRTGFIPAFMIGGLLAAVVPVINMTARSEIYVGLDGSPIQILMDANWQMMAMLNVLLLVAGACLMYHTEYADNAIWKMCMLPVKEQDLFFGKTVLLAGMGIVILAFEAIGIAFCSVHWYELSGNFALELFKSFGYAFALMLPAALLSLFIASLCENMWVSLGIGVICVFIATMLPTDKFVLSIFPFALPFQIFAGATGTVIRNMLIASAIEIAVIALAEMILLKIRRAME